MAGRKTRHQSDDVLRLETRDYLWTQSADEIVLTLKNVARRQKRGRVELKVSRRTRQLTLTFCGDVLLHGRQLFGQVVSQDCWGVVHPHGEIDIVLVKAHRTSDRSEWWPKVFVDDEQTMPGVPESARPPVDPSLADRRRRRGVGYWLSNVAIALLSAFSLLSLGLAVLSTSPQLQQHALRLFADAAGPQLHRALAADRHVLFARFAEHIGGDVLEIGSEAGTSFDYFPRAPALAYGRWTAAATDATATRRAQALALGFADATAAPSQLAALLKATASRSVDTVVSVLGLCRCDDVESLVAEVHRVLRPGGSFLFYEHVEAELGSPAHFLQAGLAAAWSAAPDGCHLARPADEVFDDGFPALWDTIKTVEHAPPFPYSLVAPCVYGAVHKPSA